MSMGGVVPRRTAAWNALRAERWSTTATKTIKEGERQERKEADQAIKKAQRYRDLSKLKGGTT